MAFVDLAAVPPPVFQRGQAVVCVPLYGAHDHFVRCIRSLLEHTPVSTPILIADDATPEPASRRFVEELAAGGTLRHDVLWLTRETNAGFVENMNDAFAASAPADLVIVNSDVVVTEGWLAGMRDAAYSDSTVATATALTNHGTIVSIPGRNQPQGQIPQGVALEDAAAAIARESARLRPRLPVAIGHCVFIRRSALELVGDFDLAFAPGYGEEVDFSQRCLAMGLQHVVADEVYVAHHGGGSFEGLGGRSEIQLAHDRVIENRYPYYKLIVEEAATNGSSRLAVSLQRANRALAGLRVTIDGRALGPALTGTQVHALELIAALARRGEARVRVLLPDDVGSYVAPALAGLGVEELRLADLRDAEPDDVVHRPWQVSSLEEVVTLRRLGHHVVLTQQDLIAYRNPAYFPGGDAWLRYRLAAAQAMALAAVTVFFSHHARADALTEELVSEHRSPVVLIGTDHKVSVQRPEPRPPRGHDLGDRPFLLCLGTDFLHKNRVFALRLLESLRERHDWQGRLVLAGPRVAMGSSAAEEAAFLAARPELREAVVELPSVDEPEKAWLMSRCAAVAYPTTYEGFGLVPFEAADAGRPCLFAHQASLTELFDPQLALLTAWDPAESADRVIRVLTDRGAAQALVDSIRQAGSRLTWDSTAAGLMDAYRLATELPVRSAARLIGSDLMLGVPYWDLRHQIGPTGLALVGPDDPKGPLLPEDVQRTIAGLARHPRTRTPLVEGLRMARRLGARARGLRSGS